MYLRGPLTQMWFARMTGLTALGSQGPAWQMGHRYLCEHAPAAVGKVSITLCLSAMEGVYPICGH